MFDLIFRGGSVVSAGGVTRADPAVSQGRIAALLPPGATAEAGCEVAVAERYLLPGLVDAHAHLREPGLSHKEDFATGTRAAIAGGVTTVLVMPTDEPWTATSAQLREKQHLAEGRIYADVGLQVALGRDLSELRRLREQGAVSFEIFIADAPGPFLHDSTMDLLAVLRAVQEADGLAAVSPGDQSILRAQLGRQAAGDGPADFAATQPPLAEAIGIARAVLATASSGARVHLRQTNSALGIGVFRQLKGMADVSIETTPQSLLLSDADYKRLGALVKASPPLRPAGDVVMLLQALGDGTVDMVATDHAPHTLVEKQWQYRDFASVPGGMPGLQTLLATMLHLVDRRVIGLPDLVRLCATTPAARFGLAGRKGSISPGADADILVLDPGRPMTVRSGDQLSKAGYSVFDGLEASSSLEQVYLRGIPVFGVNGVAPIPYGSLVLPASTTAGFSVVI